MSQLDMFGASHEEGQLIELRDGAYQYFPNFFSKSVADNYFDILIHTINWKQESMHLYGKEVQFPRLTAWYGNQDKPYSFSGITLQPEVWTTELWEIKSKIEPCCKVIFNTVMLNRYRDGNDSISWHSDGEKELGLNPVIGSVSFGAKRKFQLRHKTSKEKVNLELTHGSLLVMSGALQHHWQHQVPKTKLALPERVNLTFRVII